MSSPYFGGGGSAEPSDAKVPLLLRDVPEELDPDLELDPDEDEDDPEDELDPDADGAVRLLPSDLLGAAFPSLAMIGTSGSHSWAQEVSLTNYLHSNPGMVGGSEQFRVLYGPAWCLGKSETEKYVEFLLQCMLQCPWILRL